MYCPKCGDENEEGAKFCGNCGNPLTLSQPPEPTEPKTIAEPKPPEGFVRPVGLKILTALIAAVGLLLTYVGLQGLIRGGVPYLIVGLVSLAIAWGLWKLQNWARNVAPIIPLIMFFLVLLLSIVGVTSFAGVASVEMMLIVIIWGVGVSLYLRTIKRLFD